MAKPLSPEEEAHVRATTLNPLGRRLLATLDAARRASDAQVADEYWRYGLPFTREGQLEHSRQHRAEPSEHTLIGLCPVASRVIAVERSALAAIPAPQPATPLDDRMLDGIRDEVRTAVLEGDAQDCSSADCIADAVYEIVRVRLRDARLVEPRS